MWLVPDEDKKAFLEFFGKSSMPWTQSNPFVMRIAGWKKAPESKNSKEKKKTKKQNQTNERIFHMPCL